MSADMSVYAMECHLRSDDSVKLRGCIKQHWTDFQVNEIDVNGQIVELTGHQIPPLTERLPDAEEKPPKRPKVDKPFFPLSVDDDPHNTLVSILGEAVTRKIDVFASLYNNEATLLKETDSISIGVVSEKQVRVAVHVSVRKLYPWLKTETVTSTCDTEEKEMLVRYDEDYEKVAKLLSKVETDRLFVFFKCCNEEKKILDLDPDNDKEHRQKVHRLINELFGRCSESKTQVPYAGRKQLDRSADDRPFIQIRFRQSRRKRKQGDDDAKLDDVSTGFVLLKWNIETLGAVQRLADVLSVPVSSFSFAGTKDKRAVTTQQMVVKGVTPKRLDSARDHPRISCCMRIGNYTRSTCHLTLGHLSGNRFTVIIRDCSHADGSPVRDKVIDDAVSGIRRDGFINYFGPQRFGCLLGSVMAFDIGLALLRGNLEEAVNLMMKPAVDDDSQTGIAKRFYTESGDLAGALERMPFDKTRERLLLRGLHRHGKTQIGYQRAWLSLPYAARLLYVHSYVSLVWNCMASERLKLYGKNVVAGDLVLVSPPNAKTSRDGSRRELVAAVSAEDVVKGVYNINDVVLPLPGSHIQYPSNQIGNKYEERLKMDGITRDHFHIESLNVRLRGAYRTLVAQPSDVKWAWQQRDGKEHLLKNNPLTGIVCSENAELSKNETEQSSKSLMLTFSLGPSCYGTVFLWDCLQF